MMKQIKNRIQLIEKLIDDMNSNENKQELQNQMQKLKDDMTQFEVIQEKKMSPLTKRILIQK